MFFIEGASAIWQKQIQFYWISRQPCYECTRQFSSQFNMTLSRWNHILLSFHGALQWNRKWNQNSNMGRVYSHSEPGPLRLWTLYFNLGRPSSFGDVWTHSRLNVVVHCHFHHGWIWWQKCKDAVWADCQHICNVYGNFLLGNACGYHRRCFSNHIQKDPCVESSWGG
eukprot:SAG11_NODE_8039_length_1066_cov_1.375388_1_plen_167_part_01